jgi:UDP-N-acetyl-2-amino-2-deoxyglucuronate dehydrogenase
MTTSKNFALLGAAGYIAPKHMIAIKGTGQNLVAALDPSDSVGILDSFSYDVAFFTEFERFDRHAERLRRLGQEKMLHYISICSPNYLHDAHIRFALRIGAHAICEKPLVLNPWNLDALAEMEMETGNRIFNILQLRVHPSIVKLKNMMKDQPFGKRKKHNIDLTYITSRGNWYFHSWKGDVNKSGGIVTNIGIHFFDMLMWIFGCVNLQEVHYSDERKTAGFLELENARIRWFLSVDRNDLPENIKSEGKTTYRSITIDGEEIEFSGGFTDLHTMVYQDILDGRGFGIEDARPSINLVYELRNSIPSLSGGDRVHPLVHKKDNRSNFLRAV